MCAFRVTSSLEQREQLLRLARDTAERECSRSAGCGNAEAQRLAQKGTQRSSLRHPLHDPGSHPPATPQISGRIGGAFVTFWAGKTLRGCMGTFEPSDDISATIQEVTRSSLADPRFTGNPITRDELPDLDIEVSLLSDPTPTDDPLSLVPGRHGIIIRRGARSGCFLPKVASDRGWSAEEFLSQCCSMKAGLPADAWRDPETEVLLFESEAFAEARLRGTGPPDPTTDGP